MISIQGCVVVRSAAREHVEQQVVGSIIPPVKREFLQLPQKADKHFFFVFCWNRTMQSLSVSFHTLQHENITKMFNNNRNRNWMAETNLTRTFGCKWTLTSPALKTCTCNLHQFQNCTMRQLTNVNSFLGNNYTQATHLDKEASILAVSSKRMVFWFSRSMFGRKRHALSGSSMKYGLFTIVSTISMNSLQYCITIHQYLCTVFTGYYFWKRASDANLLVDW